MHKIETRWIITHIALMAFLLHCKFISDDTIGRCILADSPIWYTIAAVKEGFMRIKQSENA